MNAFRVSQTLQDIADNKFAADIQAVCDFAIRPAEFYNDEQNELRDIGEILEPIISSLILLGIKAGRAKQKPSTLRRLRKSIYMVTTNDAAGEAQFFFLGTVPAIRKKLNKLQDY